MTSTVIDPIVLPKNSIELKRKKVRLWRYKYDEILTVQSINNIAVKDFPENLQENPSEKSA